MVTLRTIHVGICSFFQREQGVSIMHSSNTMSSPSLCVATNVAYGVTSVYPTIMLRWFLGCAEC